MTGRRYRGQDAAERREERRARLLEAGLELIGTRGYAGTTIEALYQHARVAPRAFYEVFAGREELLRAVFDEIVADVLRAVTVAREEIPPEDVERRLRAGIEAFVEAMTDDPRRARIAYLEVTGVSASLERHRLEVVRGFVDFLVREADARAAEGLLPARDFRPTAVLLVGGTNELLLDWLERGKPGSAQDLVEELVATYVAVFTARR